MWSPAEPAVFRPDSEITEALAAFERPNPSWIIEGCDGRWMERLLPQCTELIFLNPGEDVCLRRCLGCPWEPDKYPTREEQELWLPRLLGWVRAYRTRTDALSPGAHRRLFASFAGPKREITTSGNEPGPGISATHAPPSAVEIAYGISPEYQGTGLATEAARGLVERALARGDVQTVRAHTLREVNASTRVLVKCGFQQVGEAVDPDEGPVWRWEKRRS